MKLFPEMLSEGNVASNSDKISSARRYLDSSSLSTACKADPSDRGVWLISSLETLNSLPVLLLRAGL